MTERILKSALLIIFLAGGAGLASCEKDSVTGPANEGHPAMISRHVYVVSERDSISLIEATDSLLAFDMRGSIPRIRPGFTILGTENGGYVRKVISTAVEERRLFVRTAPAYLSDAIMYGRIDTTLTLGFGSSASSGSSQQGTAHFRLAHAIPGVSVSENGLNLSGVILYSGKAGDADASVTITRGRIEFDPEVDLFVEIELNQLTGFHAIAQGTLNLDCDVEIESTGPLDFAREMPLASMSKTMIQYIRSVPVVEVVRVSFVAAFDISSKFVGACRTGVETASSILFGPQFDHGAWSYVASATPTFAPHSFSYESREDAAIMVSIKPRIDVEFYGLPCSSGAFGPYFGLIEHDMGFPVLEWELFAGIEGAMEFRHGALNRQPLVYDASLRCCGSTLDSGPFRTDAYVFITQWGSEGTADGRFGYPKGIAVDKEGNVYVVDNWNDNVQKFSSDGAFLLKWGTSGSGDGQLASPEKIAVDDGGNVYVVDGANCRVQKFSPDGAFLTKWGSRGSGEGQFLSPVGIAISQGHVFVTDHASSRVQKFSASGDFLAAWGVYGSGDGQFDGAAGIAAKTDESIVFVADCHNNRIQQFSLDGLFLASWGSGGSGDGQFDCPVDIAIGLDGTILATDIGNDRIARFTQAGAFVTELGSTGAEVGQFDHPEGVAVDGQGNLYVVDARNKRVEKFAPRSGAERTLAR